ncbi:GNAT family N-acetyltransferase [Comamonas testosteroni]|uniref:GNAT family N-acetyltransferase n=1 Tax=Comamonas testosteroni TaxID=285 RepID=A0A373FL14_COMTE|nr:GNAT family N-acetyltransferase [Comamonas testosteroni]RGE44871.1 GNAT family N-acetyltransferase [Comamonas testosteroni]
MPELMPIQLRTLAVSDVDAVLRIQAQCYGEHFVEPREVFARRLQSPVHCSWAAVRGDEVVAYLAAYWSRPGAITPLNGDFACYEDASVLYLHDMAVSAAASGHGLARRMVDAAKTQARQRGIACTALVSVQGSQVYWERQGYAVSKVTNAAQQQHLTSYGAGALYMVGLI